MSNAGKAALAELASLIERAEAAGGDWCIDERMESLPWTGGNVLQETEQLASKLRRRVAFVIDTPHH